MALEQTARFLPCPRCGQHGTIVTSFGESFEVVCKAQARELVAYLVADQKLLDVEKDPLVSAIDESNMPEQIIELVLVRTSARPDERTTFH